MGYENKLGCDERAPKGICNAHHSTGFLLFQQVGLWLIC